METTSILAEQLNHYLSLATIVGMVVVLLFASAISYFSMKNTSVKIFTLLSRYVFPLGFLITFGGAFLTLFYSEVLGYVPCDLCWYQRVFLYPQIFLFAYAWYKKDRNILPYTLMLSIIGLVVALYHHTLQIGYDLYKPCSTSPFAVDCAKPSFIEFGFVTFPFMAVVLFGFLTILITCAIRFKKN